MKKSSRILIISFCFLLFIGSLYLSLFCGYTQFSSSDLIGLFTGKTSDNIQILEILRFPRVIKAIIAGSCLAISGMFMQTMTKNPLVEPYLTGVSSGAGIALVVCILLGLSPAHLSFFAFLGAILASIIVLTFAGLNKFSLVKLILIGLSINIFASSIISMIMLTNSDKTFSMMMILAGNLNSSVVMVNTVAVTFVMAMVASIFMVPKLNFMRLDNDIVNALNNKSNYYFITIIILSSMLAAISVCAAGILGFVGIIIPHISRLIIGHDFRWLFFTNILLGSTIVLFSDFISRSIIYPTEVPLGLVLALIGAPIFVGFLILRGNKFYA